MPWGEMNRRETVVTPRESFNEPDVTDEEARSSGQQKEVTSCSGYKYMGNERFSQDTEKKHEWWTELPKTAGNTYGQLRKGYLSS